MPIEHEIRNGRLVWIRNPVTGVVSYVVDLRGKSFAFTLGGRHIPSAETPPLSREQIRRETARCPFCPGNETLAPPELMRVAPAEVPGYRASSGADPPWVLRVFNNLFPRIPDVLTGGRNESYIVVEDPRHFIEVPRSVNDLMYTGMLAEEHFERLLKCDAEVMRHAMENSSVGSAVIRKNQGRESGASQPHIHQQIIGSPAALPVVAAEARAEAQNPRLWEELIGLTDRLGLLIDDQDGVVSYASPIGAFPRSYDVMMPKFRGSLSDLSAREMRPFARALHRLITVLGPMPFDYEIHQGESVPLHAHLNARLYPYSNVAGTLNLPATLLESAQAIRHALSRH